MKSQLSNGSDPIVRKAHNPQKTVLTTGEVAKICSVAPRTVSKWFDSGQLRGYRIPGSKDRRIPLEQLVRFMRTHGMPLEGLVTDSTCVLVLDSDVPFWEQVREVMEGDGDFDITIATAAFEAGAFAKELKPSILIVNVALADVIPRSLAIGIRSIPDLQETRLIAMASALSMGDQQALLQDGFDAVLSKPFQVRELIALAVDLTDTSVSTEPANIADDLGSGLSSL